MLYEHTAYIHRIADFLRFLTGCRIALPILSGALPTDRRRSPRSNVESGSPATRFDTSFCAAVPGSGRRGGGGAEPIELASADTAGYTRAAARRLSSVKFGLATDREEERATVAARLRGLRNTSRHFRSGARTAFPSLRNARGLFVARSNYTRVRLNVPSR